MFHSLSVISQKQIAPDPVLALFGVKTIMLKLSNNQYNMVHFVTLLARRLILLNKTERPTNPLHFAERGDKACTVRKNLILTERRGDYILYDMAACYRLF